MSRGGPDVKAIFTAALALAAGPQRDAYMDAACGGDARLRRRVEELLAAFAQASYVLGPDGAPATEAGDEGSTAANAATGSEVTDAFTPPTAAGATVHLPTPPGAGAPLPHSIGINARRFRGSGIT